MIKSQIAEVVGSEMLESLIAAVEQQPKSQDGLGLKAALRRVRSTLIPPNVGKLSLADKVQIIDGDLMAHHDPLGYARIQFTQDFLVSDIQPDFKREVCRLLWSRFGAKGNPIWKNYIDGTFEYIDTKELP